MQFNKLVKQIKYYKNVINNKNNIPDAGVHNG